MYEELMTDYISREAAIEFACEDCEPWSCDGNCELLQILKQLPAADVAPVRRGKWQNVIGEPNNYFVCRCGWSMVGQKTNYGPNCGAKMDGGEEP